MDKYVTSRELSERLKAAGYPQATQFQWHTYNVGLPQLEPVLPTDKPAPDIKPYLFAAPLSDELLMQLPKTISVDGDYSLLHLIKTNGYSIAEDTYMAQYDSNIIGKGPHGRLFGDKPADALAELWLWCKEQGYIKDGR